MHQGLHKEVKIKDVVNLIIFILGMMESEKSWEKVINKGI